MNKNKVPDFLLSPTYNFLFFFFFFFFPLFFSSLMFCSYENISSEIIFLRVILRQFHFLRICFFLLLSFFFCCFGWKCVKLIFFRPLVSLSLSLSHLPGCLSSLTQVHGSPLKRVQSLRISTKNSRLRAFQKLCIIIHLRLHKFVRSLPDRYSEREKEKEREREKERDIFFILNAYFHVFISSLSPL